MNKQFLDRNLALEAVRVTEVAALSSSLHMGRGDEKTADQAAVNAMRSFLNNLSIDGTIVIGEEERLDKMLKRENRMELTKACFNFIKYRTKLDLEGWTNQDIFSH